MVGGASDHGIRFAVKTGDEYPALRARQRLRSLDRGLDNAGTPEFFYGMTKAQIRRHITDRHASLLRKRAT